MPCEIFHLPARLSSGNSGKRLSIMLAAIVCTIACMAQPATPAHHYDFRKWFRTLAQNRVEYNRYNDSIFQIRDHDHWTRFLQVRARKNHEINLSNRLIIDSINHAVTVDEVLNDSSLYSDFIRAFTLEYLRAGKADPFNTLTLCDAMQRYSDHQPDSLRMDNWLHLWRGVAYFHIFSLDNDTTTLRRSYNHFRAVLGKESERFPDYKQCRVTALYNLSNFAWVNSKIMTVRQLRKTMRTMRLMLNDTTIHLSPSQMARLKNKAERMDELLVRNVYLYDSTMMKRQEATWLMTKLVKSYKKKKDMDDEQYMNMLLMQVRLQQITAKEALDAYKSRYTRNWNLIKGERLNDKEFMDFIQQYYPILYLNDIADIPYREKRRRVKVLCREIVTAFRNRHDDQHSTQFVKMLKTLVVYERITRYLKPEERVAFLEELIVTTDLPTYAHSVHVAEIATTIISAMVKEEPQLLVGYLGCQNARSVTRHKKRFVEYMRRAAEFHDLGKIIMVPVVNNDFRPLTDMERKIIQGHPRRGLQFLELDPRLAPFHDAILGHHKWYNGKGGYPADFDNTRSPYRLLIDILTLSDCLQAATERIGRNYKNPKTYDTVTDEFRHDAGTRYNPQVVEFIDRHPELAHRLNWLLTDGWMDIYYMIYRKYIDRPMSK